MCTKNSCSFLLLAVALQIANAFGLSMSLNPAPSLKNLLNSGVDAPPIGIGLAALGRPGYITLTHSSDFPQGKSVDVRTPLPFYLNRPPSTSVPSSSLTLFCSFFLSFSLPPRSSFLSNTSVGLLLAAPCSSVGDHSYSCRNRTCGRGRTRCSTQHGSAVSGALQTLQTQDLKPQTFNLSANPQIPNPNPSTLDPSTVEPQVLRCS